MREALFSRATKYSPTWEENHAAAMEFIGQVL
jgi:hypothetical protein